MGKESGIVKQALATGHFFEYSPAFDNRSKMHRVNTVGCTEPSSFHSANAQLLKDRKNQRLPPNSKPTECDITR